MSGEPGASHLVEVDFPGCLSSCDSVVASSCDTTLSGNDLTITASATVKTRYGTCTLACGPVTVECQTDPLEAGNYNVVYGDAQGTLVVPPAVAGEPTCFGEW